MGDVVKDKGAIISKCGRYRYSLWRLWDLSLPTMVFVMLNPSTADAEHDDPTIRRCLERARREHGGLEVVNLFALRSTDPDMLYDRSAVDAIGPENDTHIAAAVRSACMVICAWGNHGALHDRGHSVRDLILARQQPWHLGLTKIGQPRHPLYLPKATEPQHW